MLFIRYTSFHPMVESRLADDYSLEKLLLTRSPHLSSKLTTFTRSLFASQISTESSTAYWAKGKTLLDAEAEMQETDTIFSARTASFPLICTFDWFLGLLENTIRLEHRLIPPQQILSNRLESYPECQIAHTLVAQEAPLAAATIPAGLVKSTFILSKPSIGIDFQVASPKKFLLNLYSQRSWA